MNVPSLLDIHHIQASQEPHVNAARAAPLIQSVTNRGFLNPLLVSHPICWGSVSDGNPLPASGSVVWGFGRGGSDGGCSFGIRCILIYESFTNELNQFFFLSTNSLIGKKGICDGAIPKRITYKPIWHFQFDIVTSK